MKTIELTNDDRQKIRETIGHLWEEYKNIPGIDAANCPFWDKAEDLTGIGYLYYEGIEGYIKSELLEEGSLLILANFLVSNYSYKLVKVDSDVGADICLLHNNLKEPLRLKDIIALYPEIDETDDEEPDFADNLLNAKEKLIEVDRGGRFP